MKKIVLLNVYGYKNIGDNAICISALSYLQKQLKPTDIIDVYCEDQNAFPKNIDEKCLIRKHYSCYGYAIHSKNNKPSTVAKLSRFFAIFFRSIYFALLFTKFKFKINDKFYRYVKTIKESDSIICVGGGYLRTKSKYMDFFGITLTLLPIYIAKFYKKKILYLPMSFGPFANSFHEYMCYHAIKNTTFLCRDEITFNIIKKLNNKKNISYKYIPDLALFLPWSNEKKSSRDYIVLTAREWMNDKKQKQYEEILALFVNDVWNSRKLKTKFIPMSFNQIEDNDNVVGERIKARVNDQTAFEILNPTSPSQVQGIFKKAVFGVCTRLHSAILATTVYTPFIAIGYEPKTLGFLKNYNLEKWHIDIEQITYKKLARLYTQIQNKKTYEEYIKKLDSIRTHANQYKDLLDHEIKLSIFG